MPGTRCQLRNIPEVLNRSSAADSPSIGPPAGVTIMRARKGFRVLESGKQARLVLLVTTAVFINYVDRGNLSTAAPLIQTELHLSATQLGILLAAFYYSYVLCMPATGWLAERFGAKSVLAAGITVWSMATALTGFAGGFFELAGLRLLLGWARAWHFHAPQRCWPKLSKSSGLVLRTGCSGSAICSAPRWVPYSVGY